MSRSAQRPGEFDLIDRYFRPLAGKEGLDLRDDVAVLSSEPGFDTVVTVDGIVEGFDFFPDDPPETVAARALRINLSDLVAKGAEPFAYLLALGLPDTWTESWIARFAAGLAREQGLSGAELIGGDMGRSGERITVTITAFGRVPSGRMVTREGAADGDVVMVSGTIGDAALGLRLRRLGMTEGADEYARHLLHRFRIPRPRLALVPVLRRYATAAMDISDGLAADLAKLCEASGVSAEIDVPAVPLSAAARNALGREPALLEAVLAGGEDYEVLFTVSPENADAAAEAARVAGVECRAVGRIVAGDAPPLFRQASGAPLVLRRLGHDHFAEG